MAWKLQPPTIALVTPLAPEAQRRPTPDGSSQMPLMEIRCGTSEEDGRVSYVVSVAFSLDTVSVNVDQVYPTRSEYPFTKRRSSFVCKDLYWVLPSVALVVTPVNCGNGRSSCDRATVAPVMVVPGNRPANGFATVAARKSIFA